jgi:hypothetical protein
VGNHVGNKLGYKQEIMDEALDRAKAECIFSDRLYDILLADQKGEPLPGRPPGVPKDCIGELNNRMTRLYNLIWSAAIDLNGKTRWKKKDKESIEVAA